MVLISKGMLVHALFLQMKMNICNAKRSAFMVLKFYVILQLRRITVSFERKKQQGDGKNYYFIAKFN
jgi:hypothetical protein